MITKLWKVVPVAALAALVAACGGAGEEEPAPTDGDDFVEAIPDADMLALGTDESGQGLTSESQGLEEGPAGFKEVGESVMNGLNAMLRDTHRGLRDFALAAPSIEITQGQKRCKVWQAAGDGVEWQLVSCEEDRLARRYAYVLRGRPDGETSEEAWLPVFGGKGAALPRFDGRRRGAGVLGYHFDNFATLTGRPDAATGKLAVGYRAAGRARQLVVALDGVVFEPGEAPNSSVFRFTHVLGRGGRFSWLTFGDFLGRDAAGEVVEGTDGVSELGRAAIAWNREGAARTVYLVCGGTLGEACFRAAQCWAVDGAETHTEIGADPAAEISWSQTACGEVPILPEAPDEADGEAPADGADGTPDVIEPAPIPEEET